jgi:hypothetical protein
VNTGRIVVIGGQLCDESLPLKRLATPAVAAT